MKFDKKAYQRMIDDLPDGFYVVDRERKITLWNQTAATISGFDAGEVLGSCCSDNILTHIDSDGNRLCDDKCPMAMTMADGQMRKAEVYLHHRDGQRLPIAVRIAAVTDENGAIVGAMQLFGEISDREANALRVQELERLALLDHLTQLANRNCLEQEVEKWLTERERSGGNLGLLYISIDSFKEFNDNHGHDLGDKILKGVATTMQVNARPLDLYGRWSGKLFIGLVRDCTEAVLKAAGNRLRLLVENTYIVDEDDELRVTVSVGATMFRAGDTRASLLRRAELLMGESRRAGGNRLTLG